MTATSQSGLVSGEAVVLDLRPASFASRGFALLLDLVIMSMTAWMLFMGVALALRFLDEAAIAAASITITVTAFVIAPVALETLTRGRSLGKMAMGLRVVRDDGGPVRFRQSFVRQLLMIVEVLLLPCLALIASLSNARGKRLGDFLAGTFVIRDRSHGGWTPATMAPELASWAAGADVGHLPEALVAATRTFLTGGEQMDPASRAELARLLADDLAAHVQPPPPFGTHPERFIASVLAERRRRDLLRLEGQARAAAIRRRRRAGAAVLSPASSHLVGPPASWSPPSQ